MAVKRPTDQPSATLVGWLRLDGPSILIESHASGRGRAFYYSIRGGASMLSRTVQARAHAHRSHFTSGRSTSGSLPTDTGARCLSARHHVAGTAVHFLGCDPGEVRSYICSYSKAIREIDANPLSLAFSPCIKIMTEATTWSLQHISIFVHKNSESAGDMIFDLNCLLIIFF